MNRVHNLVLYLLQWKVSSSITTPSAHVDYVIIYLFSVWICGIALTWLCSVFKSIMHNAQLYTTLSPTMLVFDHHLSPDYMYISYTKGPIILRTDLSHWALTADPAVILCNKAWMEWQWGDIWQQQGRLYSPSIMLHGGGGIVGAVSGWAGTRSSSSLTAQWLPCYRHNALH